MASFNQFSLILLLTLLSSLHTHARDSQFFNKVPSTTNNVVVPNKESTPTNQQQQDPNFLPENDNSYGLYGHESGQEPPSTTATPTTPATEFKQPTHKYLPKNYNPVAYVTQPEDTTTFTEERTFSNNPTNYNNGQKNFYNNNQQEEETEFRSFSSNPTNYNNGQKNYYNNNHQEEFRSFSNNPTNYNYYNGGSRSGAAYTKGGANSFQPQGMSDTRFLENGKFFYDIDAEKYSSNHPYESLRGARNEYNNRNFYGNAENNGYEFNGLGGYQNQEEFQDEENLP